MLNFIDKAGGACGTDEIELMNLHESLELPTQPEFKMATLRDRTSLGRADGLTVPMEFLDFTDFTDFTKLESSNEKLALTPPAQLNTVKAVDERDRSGTNTPDSAASDGKQSYVTGTHMSQGTCWKSLIKLLRDDMFQPGIRPDLMLDEEITPGLMYKEIPKLRRRHSAPSHPRDKWYNTGGIKSASDRFDPESNYGLRKRYGKIVRKGLSVIRFHEYGLLTRDPNTGELVEGKRGPTLFHILGEKACQAPGRDAAKRAGTACTAGTGARNDNRKRRRTGPVSTALAPSSRRKKSTQLAAQLASQKEQLEALRSKEADLQEQLTAANALIREQAIKLRRLRQHPTHP